MNFEERAIHFPCHGASLYGILSVPEQVQARGVVIVVGGPQYRAGSHRQFTLLARYLAAQGVPVLRFDYRGMGDSDGDTRTFEAIDDDVRCAIDQLIAGVPVVKEVALWGLCDAASAALFYAHQDARVTGLALLNPWVRTDEGLAKTTLKHYYADRLFERALWKKIMRGDFDFSAAGRSLMVLLRTAFLAKKSNPAEAASLPERMADGLRRFKGKTLIVLSGNDLTGQEFSELVAHGETWQTLMASANVQRHDLPGANHTFSQRTWRDQVAELTEKWLRSW